jgi:hypothetical protein
METLLGFHVGFWDHVTFLGLQSPAFLPKLHSGRTNSFAVCE